MSGIAILGAGAFGTALAITLGAEAPVTLWSRDADQAARMRETRRNDRYLPEAILPESVTVSANFADIGAPTVLLTVPTQQLDRFLSAHCPAIDGRDLVLCCKGVHLATGLRPSVLAARHCPDARLAVLTGPSFATDIAQGLPTALTLATEDDGEDLQVRLSTGTLRLYLTDDVIGAELGGALKNVIALAAGITIGAGLADSARAAVVTRGFAEMTRFAVAAGARPETLAGLSGLGDLILTCTSDKSRNYAAGLALGRGEPLPDGMTIEGVATARAIAASARSSGQDMPLTQMVAAVVDGHLTVAEAAASLMARPLKKET
jgi:glycerol-3-phosphate dehydrogenase (NAD(P)+)